MVAEKDLKNNNKVIADKTNEPIKNQSISFFILSAMMVLIKGKPLICTSVFVALLKSSKAVDRIGYKGYGHDITTTIRIVI